MSWSRPALHDLESALCRYAIALNVTFSSALILLDLMAQVMVLPQIQGFLAVDDTHVIWLARGFLFMTGIAALMTGHMAKKWGHKRVFVAGNTLYLLSGLASGLANDYLTILLFRVIAGLAGGIMMSMALPILQDTFRKPEERRPVVIAHSSLSFGGGIAAGIFIGGYFGQIQQWEWVYWILFLLNFPCLAITLLFQRETEPQELPRFDWIGFFSLSLGFFTLLVITTQGKAPWNTLGFHSNSIHALVTLSILSFALFIWNAKTHPHPIVDLSLFTYRPFVIGFFAIIPVTFLVFGITLATLGIIRENYGYEWLELAYLMAPLGLIYCIFGAIPAAFAPYLHPRYFVIAGLSLIVFANWEAQSLTIQSSWKELFYVISLRSIGVAFSLGPITTLALYRFHGEMYEKGAGVFQFIRMMGACFGSSLIQLVAAYRTPFHALRFGEQIDPTSAAFQKYTSLYDTYAGQRGFRPPQVQEEIRSWVVKQAEIQAILDAEFLLSLLIVVMLFVFLCAWLGGIRKNNATINYLA